jgi:hypothetical protein
MYSSSDGEIKRRMRGTKGFLHVQEGVDEYSGGANWRGAFNLIFTYTSTPWQHEREIKADRVVHYPLQIVVQW